MGVVIKQSAYASIINYLGVAVGAVNMIFLFPEFLSQQELGLFKAIFSMAIVMAPFAQLGLARSTLRYFPRFNKGPKSSGRFFTFILITAFFTICLFIGLFQLIDQWIFGFFEENAPELVQQYWLIISLASILVYISIFEAYYKAQLNVVIPTFMREFFLRISSSLVALIYFLDIISFEWFLRLSVATYALSLFLLLAILLFRGQLHFNFSIFQLKKPFIKQMFKYMIFIMAGAVGSVIVLQIDQLMVTSYLGLEKNAIYVIAFFMGTVIEIPKRSISQMSDAIIASAFENERLDEIKKIYKQSSINQLILGSFVFILVVINLDNIYNIMPKGDEFSSGKWIVVLIGLSKLIDMGFGVNSEIIISSKHYKTNIYFVLILALLTVSLNVLLIPRYGLTGAALATISTIFLFNLMKMVYIYYRLQFQPFSIHTLSTLLLSGLCFTIMNFVPQLSNPFLNGIYLTILATLLFGVFMLFFKPSKEITKIIQPIRDMFKL
ncbi:Membrane protein involved in the export of O-antigen and teichoic acid [Marivirga sericea]|uniref:Membrane protein involved in the export of O-antigen and teichoic acid n=1 Tax=Marivirga sericea TaxID=1028 RepID=A0A1X7K8Z8_9BACT|nr:polysaccharide biosynthesis C-terminal domain-containing protein [Marivirga sericea]SMG37413.1 Membrane protein involved in the export of O-antigen and teichoic acid [Marivirga sericea]